MTFPHTGTLITTTKVGSKYNFNVVGTSIACFLQPLGSEEAQMLGMTFSKSFQAFVPYDADVEEGNRLIVSGITYGIKGLRDHNYGNIRHKKLILEKV